MKASCFIKKSTFLFLIVGLLLFTLDIKAQNIAITDDNLHVADPSAMLDIKSTTKGLLIPRLLTESRLAINPAAIGLLVYDIDESSFYYYDGSDWINLSKGQVWSANSNYVLLSDSTARVGIGTFTPNSKLEVKADASFSTTDTLFAVKDKDGNIVFAVFPDGAKVYINETAKGSVGGFAVSGRSPTKTIEEDYLKITPDSSRIWIREDTTKGSVGGFAVSGRSPTKGIVKDYFVSTADSTRIYVNDSALAKGTVGGFAVSGRSPTKAGANSFLSLSSKNYFIGHNSGLNNTIGDYNFFGGYNSGFANTTGSRNIFIGYESGYANQGDGGPDKGSHNIFIGFQSGFNNVIGFNNIFLGNKTGYNNIGDETGDNPEDGSFNTFIGYESGFENQIGGSNTFLGYQAGFSNYKGNHNTYLGRWSGAANTVGSYNVFVGTEAGRKEMGSYKLCINAVNDFNYRVPLIYGDFKDTKRYIVIDGDSTNNPAFHKMVVTGVVNAVEFIEGIEFGKASKNVSLTEGSLDKILSLNTIKYNYLNTKGLIEEKIGIDPETSINIIPEIVEQYGTMYGIRYSKLTVLLIEAIKQQQSQINELKLLLEVKNTENEKSQIDLLIEENKKLKQDIEDIKELIQNK